MRKRIKIDDMRQEPIETCDMCHAQERRASSLHTPLVEQERLSARCQVIKDQAADKRSREGCTDSLQQRPTRSTDSGQFRAESARSVYAPTSKHHTVSSTQIHDVRALESLEGVGGAHIQDIGTGMEWSGASRSLVCLRAAAYGSSSAFTLTKIVPSACRRSLSPLLAPDADPSTLSRSTLRSSQAPPSKSSDNKSLPRATAARPSPPCAEDSQVQLDPETKKQNVKGRRLSVQSQ
nr:hypothetical protein CFP56_42151 [Quercus suber]